MKYFVDISAAEGGDGSEKSPFRHINDAAQLARPGDEVLVCPGIYREEVDPAFSGTEEARITYRSLEKNKAVITGAEPLSGWAPIGGGAYSARVPNSVFTGRNPYTTLVSGDWFNAGFIAHLGDVFLNGRSMYEVSDKGAVLSPKRSPASWEPEFSEYVWCSEQEGDETVFYANFGGKDPNGECVEFTARKACFYPSREGVSYVTVSGFTITKAATQWAPPTAYQEGMIGPHWSKGWIIEDCEISESKCAGISLGKYYQPENDNKWLREKLKDGTQTEREVVCLAVREGWTKERVGSHVVRRCNIHDCGQAGIVGHLGCAFSLIEDNHIHHINLKQNLAGAEIGGIKLHAAIDTVIRRNRIHHCTRGLWLDWQAQGTRVTQNAFHHNGLPKDELISMSTIGSIGEDVFIEVSHGPTLVDNNLLLSPRALKLPTQGFAIAHNLIAGSLVCVGRGVTNGSAHIPSPRYTPYHVPHSTEIAGFMTILHGDARFYNNIFVQQPVHPLLKLTSLAGKLPQLEWDDLNIKCGLQPYNGYPTEEEYLKNFEGYCGMGAPAGDRYYSHLPVWTGGNVYFNGASPRKGEADAVCVREKIELRLTEKNGRWSLRTDIYKRLPKSSCALIDSAILGRAFEPEQRFENPDGSPVALDIDFLGGTRSRVVITGPFAAPVEEISL
ncbi:MAG: right-handed parallel beta-helix repeat-containing protein [Oscillospiraceae bacterium]|nr:right-handed parallel beta-helix repeat-containing protein [Oscillospiraceae bacterium]